MLPEYVVEELFSKLEEAFQGAEPLLAFYWQVRNGFWVFSRKGKRWVSAEEAGAEGWVLKLLSSVIVRDWEKEKEALPVAHSLHGVPGSWIATPLMGREEPLGVLSISSPRPGAFGDHHLRLLESFSSNLALTLENAIRRGTGPACPFCFHHFFPPQERLQEIRSGGPGLLLHPLL